jgi:hypothetical protein
MHIRPIHGSRPAAYLADAIVIATIGALVFSAALRAQKPNSAWDPFAERRLQIVGRLLEQSGDDLVIVRYGPRHFVHSEWVYNSSDIDQQPIVWGRDLGPGKNADLLEYFRDRQIWLLEAEARPPRISPYQTSEAPDAP